MNVQQTNNPIDEAAEWFALLSDPACTDEERRAFARWLTRSNTNVQEFLTLSTLTRRLENLRAWPQLDMAQLMAEARQDRTKIVPLQTFMKPAYGAVRRSRFVRRFAAAAALAAAVVTSLVIFGMPDWLGRSTYSTSMGELRSVTLQDGSIVQLDARSTLETHFTDNKRSLKLLRGAAIFRVAKDARRPFVVSTGFADIQAVGTSFNVSSSHERTVVTVIEGRVAVRDSHGASRGIELDPGQQAVVEPHKPLKRTVNVDPVKVTAWTARRLYFEDTPLEQVVREFARYSSRIVSIEDPALAEKLITGTFDATDPTALIDFLRRYTDASIDVTTQGWTVSR